MTPPTLLTEWARLLLGSLREAGLRDVVLSPGSRSTPFAWAALNDPGLRCRTIIDERSAAFFALGHARITGQPALLICTSGSAAANYFPALVEAAESHSPVLVLTADRPLELQQAAGPQTIDQVKLYGDYARAYFDLGTPDAEPRMLRALPRLAAQALRTSRGPIPGPVHLNARARKPLEPRTGDGPAEVELQATVDRLLNSVPTAPGPEVRPSSRAIGALATDCRAARRGLIVCGPAAPTDAARPDAIAELARATGFPVVAEAASQLRFAEHSGPILDAWTDLLAVPAFADAVGYSPDLILQVGRPPTASSWHAAMDRWTDTRRHVLAPHGWPDPSSTAASLVIGPLDASVRALTAALIDEPEVAHDARAEGDEWSRSLRQANDTARAVIEDALDGPFTEGAAVRAVVDALPADAVLAVGNSLPIREVDTFVPAGPRGTGSDSAEAHGLTVWFQRGANGIDGLISGAAGAAAASGRPTTLLLGDVSFVHDIGGLRALRDLPAPVTIVVLNNGGGRIFERLPLTDAVQDDDALAAWLTPPGVDFQAAATTFGVPFARADDATCLTAALHELADTGGVLEVLIPDDGTTVHQREIRRRLETALAG